MLLLQHTVVTAGTAPMIAAAALPEALAAAADERVTRERQPTHNALAIL